MKKPHPSPLSEPTQVTILDWFVIVVGFGLSTLLPDPQMPVGPLGPMSPQVAFVLFVMAVAIWLLSALLTSITAVAVSRQVKHGRSLFPWEWFVVLMLAVVVAVRLPTLDDAVTAADRWLGVFQSYGLRRWIVCEMTLLVMATFALVYLARRRSLGPWALTLFVLVEGVLFSWSPYEFYRLEIVGNLPAWDLNSPAALEVYWTLKRALEFALFGVCLGVPIVAAWRERRANRLRRRVWTERVAKGIAISLGIFVLMVVVPELKLWALLVLPLWLACVAAVCLGLIRAWAIVTRRATARGR
jgi:hypothetical protein